MRRHLSQTLSPASLLVIAKREPFFRFDLLRPGYSMPKRRHGRGAVPPIQPPPAAYCRRTRGAGINSPAYDIEYKIIELYACYILYSFENFQKWLVLRQQQYHNFPMRPLNWKAPKVYNSCMKTDWEKIINLTFKNTQSSDIILDFGWHNPMLAIPANDKLARQTGSCQCHSFFRIAY